MGTSKKGQCPGHVRGTREISTEQARLTDPLFIIRAFITLACVIGFTYQATDFFVMYFKFPTTTNIRVESMKDLVFPAFTFCISNWIDMRKLCADATLNHLCKSNDTMLPPNAILAAVREHNNLESLAFDTKDVIKSCHMKPTSGCDPFDCDTEWYKSFVRYPDSYCYTLDYNRITNESHALKRCRYPWDYEMNSTIGWTAGHTLVVDPYGADASVHEHDTNSAEQAHSLFFEPQSRYIILVEQQTTLALPKPYQTKCVHYEVWKRTSRFYGMMTQNLCYEQCRMKKWHEKCGCISSRYAYRDLYGAPICNTARTQHCAKVDVKEKFTKKCLKKCRQPCKEITYEVQITAQGQKEISDPEELDESEGPRNYTSTRNLTFNINLLFASEKHTILQHLKKFTFIEVFGYLGGYVGIWLGMSFFSVLDSLILYIRDRQLKKLEDNKVHPELSDLQEPKETDTRTAFF
ncbi:amiloride-sensitive sodium channel subunit alpha-like [Ornithodoros turicata]|uniref:amiloride-sensitive sodium channel subunit alpha-like n=1 Tax=Ornithodoros turicata TaxID=34597 RepID=UPI003138EE89